MASEEKAQKRSIAVPLVVIPMADAATAATNPSLHKNQSLIDELNAALATGGDDAQKRILERVADLFAAGARGYSSQQSRCSTMCCKSSAPTSKSRRGRDWPAALPISTTRR